MFLQTDQSRFDFHYKITFIYGQYVNASNNMYFRDIVTMIFVNTQSKK